MHSLKVKQKVLEGENNQTVSTANVTTGKKEKCQTGYEASQ